jgi:hypothetical protein
MLSETCLIYSRCLEDGTRTELPLSEILDEAVNGQMESNCNFVSLLVVNHRGDDIFK